MLSARLMYLVPVAMLSACVSQPASSVNTPTVAVVQTVETPKASASDGASASSRDPAPVQGLIGAWLIEDVDQRGVMDDVQLTLAFDAEGRVSGQLGCNGVTGRFTTDRGRLSIGPLVSTRKMCASPAMMNQEALALQSLQTLNAVTWSSNGAAILTGPEGHSMTMRKFAQAAASGMAHGNISPTPVTYHCDTETVGIAFEAGAAYLTDPNGALIVLNRIDGGAGADRLETFTNGRVTLFREGGEAGQVRLAKGRMAAVECQITKG